VQASVPEPVKAALLQESVLNATVLAVVMPIPLRLITGALLVESLLATTSCPVADPGAAGLNLTFRL
jgi:hypothetical protein